MPDEKLGPCPHCGGPSKLIAEWVYGNNGPPYYRGVCSGDCSNYFQAPADAIAAWNRRTLDGRTHEGGGD